MVQLRLDPSPLLSIVLSELDSSHEELQEGRVEAGMVQVELALGACRTAMSRSEWFAAATGPLRHHDIAKVLREDPLTAAGAACPRGGIGEARVLDLMLDADAQAAAVPALTRGQRIHAFTAHGDTAFGWRWRRQFLADAIRQLAGARANLRILTIGAGHVREADLLSPEVIERIAQWTVVDHDAAALARATARHPDIAGRVMRAVPASARDILTGQFGDFGMFDLVYAPGFFDMLTDGMALVLAQRLLDRCASGGRLLIPNATADVADAAYFEVWLDWVTTPRTEADMLRLLDGARTVGGVGAHTVIRDPRGTTVCLNVERV